MAPGYRRQSLHPHVLAVMDEAGEDDPFGAVRVKARRLVQQFHESLGETPPFNLEALASFRGLHSSDAAPRYSRDSEIVPESGRVVLRVNRDRPQTRQRFSVGHEVGHTLFPDYHLAVRCRKAIERDWADPADLLETLCDVAASEFLFPEPWFHDQVAELALSAGGIATLATTYLASRDATVRRLVEVHPQPLAAVFLSWKLKPSELKQQQRDRRQRRMFDGAEPQLSRKLRVDYGILNTAFADQCCDHIPKDKSVPSEGPIYEASVSQEPRDGALWLDFGSVARDFVVHALPVYTPDELVGPDGAVSVVAVISPAPRRRKRPKNPR